MLGLKRFAHFAWQTDMWLIHEFVYYFAMEGLSPRFQSKVNSSECLDDEVDASASNIVSHRLGRSHHHHLLVNYNGVGSLHTADDTLAFSFWNDRSWNHCALRTLDFLWVCRSYNTLAVHGNSPCQCFLDWVGRQGPRRGREGKAGKVDTSSFITLRRGFSAKSWALFASFELGLDEDMQLKTQKHARHCSHRQFLLYGPALSGPHTEAKVVNANGRTTEVEFTTFGVRPFAKVPSHWGNHTYCISVFIEAIK